MEKILNYINGEFVAPQANNYIENIEPAEGTAYSFVPDSDERDVDAAVDAADSAFPLWSALTARERARYLRRIAQAIEAQLEELAAAESRDSGKPLKLARTVDIPRSAYNFEFFADAITQFGSESYGEDCYLNYTQRNPLGVVGCISPWNLPLYLLTWKIAPALAAGNCVVAKPSEITPYTAMLLARICNGVGLPAGVLNIVHGRGPSVGTPLTTNDRVKGISFTGSTATGAAIARLVAPKFKKHSLEMGGKNPNIIFADCDIDEAVSGTLRAAFTNQGQICLCGSRIFVERSIYENFKERLVARVKTLRCGDPKDANTDQGALVSQAHFDKVLNCIERAVSDGGRVLTGGSRARVEGRCSRGYFIQPTLIEGLSHACETNQEEIFGPVATLSSFQTEDEVLQWANSTRYGLAATVWTRDVARAHRVAAKIESGIVWINCWMVRDLRTPFGGVKDSGVGREGGVDALRFFTEPKNICLRFE